MRVINKDTDEQLATRYSKREGRLLEIKKEIDELNKEFQSLLDDREKDTVELLKRGYQAKFSIY